MNPCLSIRGARSARPVPVIVLHALFSIWLVGVSSGASAPPEQRSLPELSDRVRDALVRVNHLMASDAWPDAADSVRALMQTSAPGSYDHAMAHLHHVQIELSRGDRPERDHQAAIASLEFVLRSGFWSDTAVLDFQYTLAQLYAIERMLLPAERLLEEWLERTTTRTTDAYRLLVSVMLERAHGEIPDVAAVLLERALARINEGLRLGVRPDPTLLHLKAACFQELGRWDEAAENLEFMASLSRDRRGGWDQIYAMYAAGERDLPAILTIERARAHGALDSPASDVALGQHYHRLGQDRLALDALETALRRGIADPAPHGIFAAYLAYTMRDYDRTRRLLAAVEPTLTSETQRQDHARLAEAVTARDTFFEAGQSNRLPSH